MIEVKGYVCSCCKGAKKVRRVYATPSSCSRHEAVCYHNPKMQACATCEFWQPTEVGMGTPDDPAATAEVNQCIHGHDRIDTGMCNGTTYPPAPQRECEYWSRVSAPGAVEGER